MKTLHTAIMGLSLFSLPGFKSQDKSPRAYFEEIKNAGGFMHTVTDVEGEKHSFPDTGYVCFADNNPMAEIGGVFLTFGATAYDKNHAEAEAKWLISEPNSEDGRKALAKMRETEDRYSYVMLLSDDLMALSPADAADFFRKGGQELDLSLYMHGVKRWTASLHRFNLANKWDSTNQKMDFAVEPSTFRFLWSVRGDKSQVINGRCEKIYQDALKAHQ